MDIKTCDELLCKIQHKVSDIGEWKTWNEWSQCSTTCGPGIQIRYRDCKKVRFSNS